MVKEKLDRINYLAKKSKQEALTPEEAQEQAALRKEYLEEFRRGFRAQLENIVIVDEDGNRKPLKKDIN
ncbi:MAG: DUF896 domain-containing protein [Clostridia bacterium]|nr:DUF896 domain-containing protein [Clostridia bacterium]